VRTRGIYAQYSVLTILHDDDFVLVVSPVLDDVAGAVVDAVGPRLAANDELKVCGELTIMNLEWE
jgi:hypothetical protein